MGRREFIVRRVVQIVILYFVIGSVLFFMFRFAPGDPMSNFIVPGITQEKLAELRASFGLDEPMYIQYLKWLKNMATFNLGVSYIRGKPVMEVISGRMLNTILLMGTSVLLAYLFAVPLGAYMAWNRGTVGEQAGVVLSLISRSSPVFWVGLTALWLFAYVFSVFPAGGMLSSTASYSTPLAKYLNLDFVYHLILPAFVQAFYYFSLPALLMRNSMLDVMNEDFVHFADLKGVEDRKVMLWHAARNASLPVVTAFATGAAYAIGGSVVIETVFVWPGLGREMVRAILQSDYPVAQGAFLILAIFVLVANLLADIAYGYLDPRVTYD
ncbi:MAG: ABC transporter permease [Haloglomus sp.]